MMNLIYDTLCALRVPLQTSEYDLHARVIDILTEGGYAPEHEVPLAPRCRIDLMCGDVGIEIKRGKPERGRLIRQLSRYAACERVSGIILIAEGSVDLPRRIGGKPVRVLCLNRLWGIAL